MNLRAGLAGPSAAELVLTMAVVLLQVGCAQGEDAPPPPPPIEDAPRAPSTLGERLNAHQPHLVAPDAFGALPPAVRSDLVDRGCGIPQIHGQVTPENVIRGAFAEPGSEDWAVLCSIGGVSTVLLYWETLPGPCASAVGASENADWNQGMGEDAVAFSRLLKEASPQDILSRRHGWSAPDIPADLRIEHDGFHEVMVGKGSTIHYCWQGEWLALPGAD